MGLDLLTDGMYVLRGAVNSVVVTEGESALLVDTGLDESHARKLLRAVQEAGFTPRAVLNTHSHADHHGGNAFLLGRLPDLPVFTVAHPAMLQDALPCPPDSRVQVIGLPGEALHVQGPDAQTPSPPT